MKVSCILILAVILKEAIISFGKTQRMGTEGQEEGAIDGYQ